MVIISLLFGLMAVQSPQTARVEDRLLAGAIDEMARSLTRPSEARFRNVYVRWAPTPSGRDIPVICGEMNPQPSASTNWIVFTGAVILARPVIAYGDNPLVEINKICSPSAAGWDRSRDFSAQFEAALRHWPSRDLLPAPGPP